MVGWLYQRLREENQNINPDFSLRGTANWLHALSWLCNNKGFSDIELFNFYKGKVQRRPINRQADTLVFEQIMMAFHQLSALHQISEHKSNPYDAVRSAIVAWYYGLYYAGGAMVAATDGSHQEDHAGTARAWKSHLVDSSWTVSPFSLSVSSLVEKTYEQEIHAIPPGPSSRPNSIPYSEEDALGVCLSNLKGSAKWYREREERRIRGRDREFKKLGFDSFRKKDARLYRDARLQRKSIGFLHQAYRYRGKAHYRDAIYLSYGEEQSSLIADLNGDLYTTLQHFIRMASYYCSMRVERGTWSQFVADIEENSLLSHDVDTIHVSESREDVMSRDSKYAKPWSSFLSVGGLGQLAESHDIPF